MKIQPFKVIRVFSSMLLAASLILLLASCGQKTTELPRASTTVSAPVQTVVEKKPIKVEVGDVVLSVSPDWARDTQSTDLPAFYLGPQEGLISAGYVSFQVLPIQSLGYADAAKRDADLENSYQLIRSSLTQSGSDVASYKDRPGEPQNLTLFGHPARIYPLTLVNGDKKFSAEVLLACSENQIYLVIWFCPEEEAAKRLPIVHEEVLNLLRQAKLIGSESTQASGTQTSTSQASHAN